MSGFYDGALYAATVFVDLNTMPIVDLARQMEIQNDRLDVLINAYNRIHINGGSPCSVAEMFEEHRIKSVFPKFIAEWAIGYTSLAVARLVKEIDRRSDIR